MPGKAVGQHIHFVRALHQMSHDCSVSTLSHPLLMETWTLVAWTEACSSSKQSGLEDERDEVGTVGCRQDAALASAHAVVEVMHIGCRVHHLYR